MLEDSAFLNSLLQRLKAANIRLALDERGGLRVRSQGVISESLLAELKAHKEALLQWLKSQHIVSQGLQQKQLLTSQQLRVWHESTAARQLTQNDPYLMPMALLLNADVSLAELETAIQRILKAHPALSLVINEEKGQVWQYYQEQSFAFKLQTLDLESSDKAALQTFCGTRLERFSLNNHQRLWQAELYQLSDKHYLLFFVIHHLISDGQSNQLLLADMLSALKNDVAEQRLNYLDYAAWQNKTDFSEALAYWQQALHDIEPISLAKNAVGAAVYQSKSFQLDTQALDAFCQSHAISRFSYFYSLWAFVLAKLSATDKVIITSPDANRRRPEWQRCVGFFANTVFLPARINHKLSLVENMQLLHQQLQQHQAYVECPFEQIILQSPDKKACLDTAIHYQAQAMQQAELLSNKAFEILPFEQGFEKNMLSFNINDGENAELSLSFDAQRLESEFIELIAAYIERLHQLIMQQPSLSFEQLSLLNDTEKASLLALPLAEADKSQLATVFQRIYSLNQTAQTWPCNTILPLIYQQVEKAPYAVAVSDEDSKLSYQELWQQSGLLAQSLFDAIGSNHIVALCLDRSVQVSVVLLAILRSGNAYLPLDKKTPKERLHFQLNNSEAALLIYQASEQALFEQVNCLAWRLDNLPKNEQTLAENWIDSSLFNLIYTSGSTGQPKGVRVLHSGIANRLQWMQAHYAISANDTVLQKTPLSFDVSVWELFLPLMAGARLHFAPPDSHKDAWALQAIIEQQKIEVLHFVPSMLRLFLELNQRGQHQPRLVFCSGEALVSELINKAKKYWPATQWHNLYGPTEASVDVSFFACQETNWQGENVPIGQAIANTQLHIVDSALQPVSPFVEGEIIIAGQNLAEGYHNLPEQSAKQFIHNPYYLDGHPSLKLYKTGDRGRFLADGSIEFLGRQDGQVKLRGLRIELGDIEAQALKMPEILAAAAMVVEEQEQQSLVLFYRAEKPLEQTTLRQFLLHYISPNTMPNAFVFCESLPLTSSGKLDRKALVALYKNQAKPVLRSESISELEQSVLSVWQQNLSQQAIGLDDDFFALGGHSLLAGKIVAELSEQLQCDLRLADFWQASTIRSMAEKIKSLEKTRFEAQVLPEKISASLQQKRLLIHQQWQDGRAYHMPLALQLEGEVNHALLEQVFQHSLKQHAILRCTYQQQGDEIFLQHSDKTWHLSYQESQKTAAELLHELNQQAFDLSQDLPLRACLVKQSEQRYLLLIVLHHIAGDAGSLETLAHQWLADYQALLHGKELAVIEQPEDYRHYALWQSQQDFSESFNYWQQQLADASDFLSLPSQAEENPSAAASSLSFVLDSKTSQNIQAFCQQQAISPFLFFLSIYQLLLAKLALQDEVNIALPVSGRHKNAWQQSVGFFVNTVIIRSQQEKNPRLVDFLQQQKQLVSQALQHQDVALEDVFAVLARKRSKHYTPIVQVGFNFLEALNKLPNLQLENLNIQPLDLPTEQSKTDLNWIVYPQSGQYQVLVEYQTARFSAKQLSAWFDSFNYLIEQALAHADLPIHLYQLKRKEKIRKQLQLQVEQQFLPLNPMQQAIAFDSVLFPDNKQNRIGFYSLFKAAISPEIWQQSLNYLYRHNDLLRSALRFLDEKPYLVINPVSELPAHYFSVFEHSQEPDIQQKVEQCLHQSWDISKALWRVHLHLMPNQQVLFVAAFHHSAFDGVSIQQLGRLIKGNVERLLTGQPLQAPRNDFAELLQCQLRRFDQEHAWNFWQQRAAQITAIPKADAEYNQQLNYLFNGQEEAQLKVVCRQNRITPALFFKALFALTAKYIQGVAGDFVFYEIVTGRNKASLDAIGVLFEQQPNILPASSAQNDFSELLQWFKSHRKEVGANTPLSLSWQKKLFPESTPFIFNFYIMETVSSFLGQEERIQHSIPPIEGAVNLVCQIVDGKTQLQLNNIATPIHGEVFWALLLQAQQRLLAGETELAKLYSTSQGSADLHDIFQQPCQDFVYGNNAQGELAYYDGERLHTLKALPVNDENIKPIIAAQNPLEQKLLSVWQEVLGKSTISTEDDFFELGGHSLSAMRIAHRLRENFGIEIPLAALFEQPTIKAIAAFVEHNPNTQNLLPPISKTAEQAYWPLSFAQQRLLLLSQIEGVNNSYNIAAAIEIQGVLNRSALRSALNELLQRHSVLRSRIKGFEWTITTQAECELKEHALDKSGDVLAYCQSQANKPFASFEQSLLRLELIKLDEHRHVLLWVIHHIICDAKSLMVLAKELWFLYQAHSQGQTVKLPKASLDYQDYCVWQQQTQHHPVLEQQFNYWQQELKDAPLLLGLPIDKARKQKALMPAGHYHFSLEQSLADKLKLTAQKHGISLFMLLLAGYQLLLAKRCQQSDICIGIPREGRPSSALEETVGFFVNALVIRNHYQQNLSLIECLQAVKSKVLNAFSNEQVPAERVIQALQLPRDLHYTPIVQAAFNFVQAPELTSFDLADLSLRLLDLPAQNAKFECLLSITEQNGQLLGSFEYDSSLFYETTVASFAELYQRVLVQLCDENISHIEQISLQSNQQLALSFMQKDLYLASIAQPESLDHSIGYALELPLAIDKKVWQQVHQACLAHYPMLRARLKPSSEQFMPSWAFDQNPEIELLDWTAEQLTQEELEQRLKSLVQQRYDLPEQPLLRFYLIKLAEQRFYTVLACHHILLDGKSFTLHAYHQVTNYFALKRGEALQFAEDNFADYLAWQQNHFNTSQAFAYWQEQLASTEPLQAEKQSDNTAIKLSSQTLEQAHWQAIEHYCHANRTTPALYFKALYSILLQTYCRADNDFVLFDFNDGRGSRYLTAMGCHYYRQMHKVSLSSLQGTFKALLKATRQQQKQATKHRLSLQAQSQLLDKNHASFSYNFLYMPKSGSTEGMDFNGYSYSPEFANNTDLRVQLDKGECSLTLCYQESVFAPLRFIERLVSLSQQVLAGTETIADLNLLLVDEISVYKGKTVSPAATEFHFSQSSSIAIIQGDKILSHQQLAEKSNQLAHYLLAQGLEKGQRVGLCFGLEVEFFIALLAVVKAGGCYVPMDKSYPQQRLQSMVDTGQISYVISSEGQEFKGCKNECLAELSLSAYPISQPNIDFQPDDLLYLMFTSGSTGEPKAAAIYRRNFANLLRWYSAEYQINQHSKALLIASIGFDLSQKNFFAFLQAGGSLVLPETAHYDAKHYRALIQQQAITHINCAPSAFYPLLDCEDGSFSALASLQVVLLGGEPIQIKALKPWLNQYSGRLVNMYGPSECTDIATVYDIHAEQQETAIPLGQPIDGVELRLLNSQRQNVPNGLTGEIAISGAGLGAGYWQNPRLTEQHFIDLENKPYYLTGDLAKLTAQGELQFFGRKDFQVKRHGVRIELPEIEALLEQIEGISEAHVLLEDEELLAFVKADHVINAETLQQMLAQKLPQSMLPNQYIAVDEWPLTAHGKLDRNALLGLERGINASEKIPPRNAVERRLQQLWQEVLGKPVGIYDNFFALGGDSLSAVRLVHQIELNFEKTLAVASLFNAQTIADLALLLQGEKSEWSPLVTLQNQGEQTPLFAFHALGGMVLNYYPLAESLGKKQPFYALQAYGFEEGQQPYDDLNSLVEAYIKTIKQQQKHGPYRLIGHSFGGLIAVEAARKLIQAGEEIEQLVLIETYMPNQLLATLSSDAMMLKVFAEQNFNIKLPLLALQKISIEQAAELIAEKSQGRISAAFVERSLAIVKGFKAMMQGYRVAPLNIPITLVRAEQELGKVSKKLSSLVQRQNANTLGWEKVTQQLQVEVLEGGHETVLLSENLAVLLSSE